MTPLQYIIIALILLFIFASLTFIIINQFKTMATLAQLQSALTDLQASVDANQEKVIAEIQALKDQIAAGSGVTAEDLDNLITTVKAINKQMLILPKNRL